MFGDSAGLLSEEKNLECAAAATDPSSIPPPRWPVSDLMEDEQVTEILLMGPDSIWYEKSGQLQQHTAATFSSAQSFHQFLNQCLDEAAVVVDLKRPFGDGLWRGFRLHVSLPPLTEQVCLSLRRQKKTCWTLKALLEQGWCEPSWAEKIVDWFAQGRRFIIYGETGSGKTATAEALLHTLPENCRTITLEDTRELRPPNSASLGLLTRPAQGDLEEVSYADLLRQALRMRPDRIIMGEIRGAEAKDFLMVLASGHCGGLATLHAESAQRALLRLEMLVQLGAPQWDLRSVRLLISHSIHYLIKVGRGKDGRRKLQAIDKIDGLEETGFLLDSLSV